jgi:fructosamine-3-kinase
MSDSWEVSNKARVADMVMSLDPLALCHDQKLDLMSTIYHDGQHAQNYDMYGSCMHVECSICSRPT